MKHECPDYYLEIDDGDQGIECCCCELNNEDLIKAIKHAMSLLSCLARTEENENETGP